MEKSDWLIVVNGPLNWLGRVINKYIVQNFSHRLEHITQFKVFWHITRPSYIRSSPAYVSIYLQANNYSGYKPQPPAPPPTPDVTPLLLFLLLTLLSYDQLNDEQYISHHFFFKFR